MGGVGPMLFLTNLQKPAFDHHDRSGTDPQGWLLSSHRTTESEAERANAVRAASELLMADNGTIVHIRSCTAAFEHAAEEVVGEFRAMRATLPGGGRDPAFDAVPAAIRDRGNAVATGIADLVDDAFASIDPEEQTEVQRSIGPTHLVCKEDWSIAVALGLGLERHLTGWSIPRYVTRNRQSLRGWRDVASTGDPSTAHYVTLAAPDYPTARAVAREAARWGAENVALGFAGLNSTADYTTVTRRPHRRHLPSPAPRRYVRLAEIVTGFRDGFRDADGTLQRFHALGLGARPMWPILAAGLDWWTDISIDATSAIKDATGRRPVLYDPERLAGRIAVADVAAHVIDTGELPFPSPVLAPLLDTIDTAAARAWISDVRRAPGHDDLRVGRPLADAMPVFAHGPDTAETGRAWAAHNYWASEQASAAVPTRGRRRWATERLTELRDDPDTSVTVRYGAAGALEVLREP